MIDNILKFLAATSNYLAHRKGLLPLIGVGLILLDWLLVAFLPVEWPIVRSNFFLHLGLVVALLGLMLAQAL